MAKKKRFKSTQLRAERVKAIIRENYEAGRQDKCKLAIYRSKVKPLVGISERTFWRLMAEVEAEMPALEDKSQLRLF
jgi:hypothetical protein